MNISVRLHILHAHKSYGCCMTHYRLLLWQHVSRLMSRKSPNPVGSTAQMILSAADAVFRVVIPVCISTLAACGGLAKFDPVQPSAPPDETALGTAIVDGFRESKLSGVPEASELRQARGIQPGDWFICLKGSAEERPQYSIFFRGNSVVQSRFAALIDGCDKETYHPVRHAVR